MKRTIIYTGTPIGHNREAGPPETALLWQTGHPKAHVQHSLTIQACETVCAEAFVGCRVVAKSERWTSFVTTAPQTITCETG